MRIAYLVNAPRKHLTGAAGRALTLAGGARERGDHAVILGPAGSGLQLAAAQRDIEFEAAPFSALNGGAEIRTILARHDVDVVHAMSTVPAVLANPRLLVRGASRRRAIFVSVVVDPDSPLVYADARPRPFATWLRARLLAHVSPALSGVFAVSGPVCEKLRARGVRGVVTLGGAAIDLAQLSQRATEPIELPAGRPRIGSAVGQLEPLKGIDVLLEAFVRVVEVHPDATCLIAGEGSQHEALTRLAHQLGIAKSVHFLGYLQNPAPFLAALDLHVSPSLTEGLGTVTAQAMALGAPVIATDVGGASDVVSNGVSGLLVRPADPDALADAMIRLLGDQALASSLSAKGRELVLAHHSAERFVDETWAHYKRAVTW